jgi:hypothetical protein
MPLPDFGIDPALLASASQAASQNAPQSAAPSPLDAVNAALEALRASGAPPAQPSLYGTGWQDTELVDPSLPDPNTTAQAPSLSPGRPSAQYDAQGRQIHGYALPEGAVTITGQQREPTAAEARTQARQNALNDPSIPLAPDDVQGYAYREQRALEDARAAKQREMELQSRAANEEAEQLADAHKQYAFDLSTADSLYQQARQAAHSEADMETKMWLHEYQQKASEEPNTGRWWDNQSGLGKALWALSLLFGAAHTAVTPGAQNVALQMVRSEINRDISLQKERLQHELEGLKMKGQLMDKRQARNLTDMADDHTMYLGRLEAMKQAYLARAAAPGAAAMQASLAAVDAWFAGEEAELAGRKFQSAVQVKEGQLQRAHAAHIAGLQRNLQWNMQSREIAKDYDLSAAKTQADMDKAKLAAMKDVEGVPMRLGAKMVGSPLGTETIQVSKENAVKMRGVFDTANRRYDAMRKVMTALEEGSFADRMVMGDPELNAAARYLGYTTGKELDPAGRLSDQDVKFATTIDLGFDPGGGPWSRFKFETKQDAIKKMIGAEMRAMSKKVALQAETFLNPNLVGEGTKIVWSPQALYSPEQDAPNVTEALSSAGLGPNIQAPKTVAEFERALAMENADPMFRGRTLPSYDKGAVNEFATAVQGVSPTMIRQLADKTTKDLNTNTDPWAGGTSTADQTTKLAIESTALKAIKDSEKLVRQLNEAAHSFGVAQALRGYPKPKTSEIVEMARKDIGLTDAPDEVEAAVTKALEGYESVFSWKRK